MKIDKLWQTSLACCDWGKVTCWFVWLYLNVTSWRETTNYSCCISQEPTTDLCFVFVQVWSKKQMHSSVRLSGAVANQCTGWWRKAKVTHKSVKWCLSFQAKCQNGSVGLHINGKVTEQKFYLLHSIWVNQIYYTFLGELAFSVLALKSVVVSIKVIPSKKTPSHEEGIAAWEIIAIFPARYGKQ